MKVVGVIPAKAASTRIAEKNLQEILGVPLYLWAANNLSRVLARRDIYIDSNSEQILDGARSYGYSVIRRPERLASNATDGNQLLLWEASQVSADVYLQHLPPMPFLREATIEAAVDFLRQGGNSAFTVTRSKWYRWDASGPTYDLDHIPNSFTLDDTIVEGMGFYATRASALDAARRRVAEPYQMLPMDHFERVDIDYPEDLEFARSLAQALGPHSPWTKGITAHRRAASIRFLALDVDGVLTDGGLYRSESGDEGRKFNVRDLLALTSLARRGIRVGIIESGANASSIERQFAGLGLEHIRVGNRTKLDVLHRWLSELSLSFDDAAYIGDDVDDIAAMKAVALAVCPSDAAQDVRREASLVLSLPGGAGCVREFVDEHCQEDKAEGETA